MLICCLDYAELKSSCFLMKTDKMITVENNTINKHALSVEADKYFRLHSIEFCEKIHS